MANLEHTQRETEADDLKITVTSQYPNLEEGSGKMGAQKDDNEFLIRPPGNLLNAKI